MKKRLAIPLLLLMCLSACAPSAEVLYLAPSPDADATEQAVKDTPAPEADENALRLLISTIDAGGLGVELPIADYAQDYRAEHGQTVTPLATTVIGNQFDPDDHLSRPGIAASYFDAVSVKLMSGDADFDMFFIGGSTYIYAENYFNSMLRKDYFASMESLGLAALFDGMLPGVKALCSADGEILLAPIGFGLAMKTMKPSALQKLGITMADIPTTAGAYTDFLLGMKDKMEAEKVALLEFPFASYLFTDYEGQYVTEFMTRGDNLQPMWDALVDTVDRLYHSELCVFEIGEWLDANWTISMPYDFPYIYHTDTLYAQHSRTLTGSRTDITDDPYLPYMLLTEDSKDTLYFGSFFAVNPNSKKLPEVAEFLSTILDKDFRLALNANHPASERWMIYDNPDYEEYPDYRAYKETLPHVTRSFTNLHNANAALFTFTDYMAYHNGTLTSAEWKAKIDRELEFLRDE